MSRDSHMLWRSAPQPTLYSPIKLSMKRLRQYLHTHLVSPLPIGPSPCIDCHLSDSLTHPPYIPIQHPIHYPYRPLFIVVASVCRCSLRCSSLTVRMPEEEGCARHLGYRYPVLVLFSKRCSAAATAASLSLSLSGRIFQLRVKLNLLLYYYWI